MCVLLVEDEAAILMDTTQAFEDAGHEVLTATTAKQAILYLETMPGRFTALVSDLNMPGELTGMDVIDHARSQYPWLPMVLVTALPDHVTLDWLDLQRVSLLKKPYRPGALLSLVHTLKAH